MYEEELCYIVLQDRMGSSSLKRRHFIPEVTAERLKCQFYRLWLIFISYVLLRKAESKKTCSYKSNSITYSVKESTLLESYHHVEEFIPPALFVRVEDGGSIENGFHSFFPQSRLHCSLYFRPVHHCTVQKLLS